jgi:hypothetical protein
MTTTGCLPGTSLANAVTQLPDLGISIVFDRKRMDALSEYRAMQIPGSVLIATDTGSKPIARARSVSLNQIGLISLDLTRRRQSPEN